MNIQLASLILNHLAKLGVNEYVVCAGARNAPFVKLLGQASGARASYFFDERAAGFFALGRARRDMHPVVVITTSGTAVAELLPSAIEAFYQGVPLVFLTADRPKNFRGSAAPQVIEQVGIFSHYAKAVYDIEDLESVDNVEILANSPTHINVCFSEPLLDQEIVSLNLLPGEWRPKKQLVESPVFQSEFTEQAEYWGSQFKKPLIVLGAISTQYRSAIYESLQELRAPIYAEAQSGLRESTGLSHLLIRGGAENLDADYFIQNFDSVIRMGSVPSLRLWRDLEDKLKSVSVLSVHDLNFSGLARKSSGLISYEEWLQLSKKIKGSAPAQLLLNDQKLALQKEKLLDQYSHSEPGFFKWLSKIIPNKSLVFLGNSLPIREWDFAATTEEKEFCVCANRGANGIDGLLSTYLGSAKNKNENWIVLGDLSALYDLNALAFTSFSDSRRLRVVIINNSGGQIFKKMFKDANFINSHQFEFSKWAEMFGWDYLKITEPKKFELKEQPTVIEIFPSAEDTEKFWSEYEGKLT